MNQILLFICFLFTINISAIYSQSNYQELSQDSLIDRIEGTWQAKYGHYLDDTCRTFLTINFNSDTSGTWIYSNCIEELNDKLKNIKSFKLQNDEGIKFKFLKRNTGSYFFRLYQIHPILNTPSGFQDVKLGHLGFNVMNLYPVELFKKIKESEPVFTDKNTPVTNYKLMKISGGHLKDKVWRNGKYIKIESKE